MKNFIHRNAAYLLANVLFVSLCFNYRWGMDKLHTAFSETFLFHNDFLGYGFLALHNIVGLGLTVYAWLLVRHLFRMQKGQSGLTDWNYAGIVVVAILAFLLPIGTSNLM